ncbi:hypothetical protein [Megalodesulfovibrio paquesii]
MKFRVTALLVIILCAWTVRAQAAEPLFFADFNSGPRPEFSESRLFRLDKAKVLGIFNNKNRKLPGGTVLTLDHLPTGKPLELTFDLYLIGNWESRGQSLSDSFTVHADDEQVLLLNQFPCKINNNDEAQAVDSLGLITIRDHTLGYWMVPVNVEIPAALVADGKVEIRFHARLTGQGTEFWALDNVRVTVAN